jgi:hypothetical protein
VGLADPPASDAGMNNSSAHSLGGCDNLSGLRRLEKI